jgi:hypothetical protein
MENKNTEKPRETGEQRSRSVQPPEELSPDRIANESNPDGSQGLQGGDCCGVQDGATGSSDSDGDLHREAQEVTFERDNQSPDRDRIRNKDAA